MKIFRNVPIGGDKIASSFAKVFFFYCFRKSIIGILARCNGQQASFADQWHGEFHSF